MKILKILAIFGFFIALQSVALAATSICHTLEVPLPGMSVACGPADYLSNAYKIALGAGVFTAAVVIIYAGIMMAVSGDNASKQKDARDQIFQAILGLIILFGSYLILRTINPDLVKLGQWQNLPAFQINAPSSIITRPECEEGWKKYEQCYIDKKCGEVGIAPAENNRRLMECKPLIPADCP